MSRRTHLIWKLLPSLLFPLVILAIGVYVFASSFGYKFITASFAGAFAGVLIVLTVALLLRDIRRGVAEPTPGMTVFRQRPIHGHLHSLSHWRGVLDFLW